MKSFFTKALMGVAAVQAITVENTSQADALQATDDIAVGDSVVVRCVYNDARGDRDHDNASVQIGGIQTATVTDQTTDDVNMWFAFRGMGIPDNTIRARLFQASGSAARRWKKCTPPGAGDTIIQTVNISNSDQSSNAQIKEVIPGTTLSLWDSRDMLSGIGGMRNKLVWTIDANDKDGVLVNIGCCGLEEQDIGSLENDYETYFGPAGLDSDPALDVDDEFCMLSVAPPVAAADVAVVSVEKDVTATASTGDTPLANSVLDALTTETVIPQIVSIAPVTTSGGLCAGFDLVYSPTTDVDLYDTTNTDLVVGTPVDLSAGTPNYYHIAEMYSSPDQLNKDILAFKLVILDSTDDTLITELMCGRYIADDEDEVTNLICNGFSTVIGMSAVADSTTGGITELTATSVPVFGNVSAAQTTAYQSI